MAKDLPEVRIKGVPKDVHDDLKNIAANIGISISNMLRPKLREIRDSYSEKMRTKRES